MRPISKHKRGPVATARSSTTLRVQSSGSPSQALARPAPAATSQATRVLTGRGGWRFVGTFPLCFLEGRRARAAGEPSPAYQPRPGRSGWCEGSIGRPPCRLSDQGPPVRPPPSLRPRPSHETTPTGSGVARTRDPQAQGWSEPRAHRLRGYPILRAHVALGVPRTWGPRGSGGATKPWGYR